MKCPGHRWEVFSELSQDDDDPVPVKRWKRCRTCRRRVNLPLEPDSVPPIYSTVSMYDCPTWRPPAY